VAICKSRFKAGYSIDMHTGIEFIKFVAAGIANVLLTFAVYVALVGISTPYALANALAWILGIAFSYFLNSTFVFKKKHPQKYRDSKRFVIFCVAYSLNFVISSSLLAYLVETGIYDPVRAQYIVIPITVFLNYLASKLIVFRVEHYNDLEEKELGRKSCVKQGL
jgi:putative flippase GtrA